MPSIYSLKPRFQNLLRPIVKAAASAGVTANQVTLFARLLSVAVGATLSRPAVPHTWLLALPVLLFVRMALNAVDGMLAREFNQKSDLGAYLNELTDVISDAFLYLPFAWQPTFDPLWIGVVIVLSVISEMAGVLGVMVGAARHYEGPMGKSDRAFWFGAMALWLGLGGTPWANTGFIFTIAVSLLLTLTIWNRVRNGLAEAGRKEVR
jgi:CDP-diacylglycerol--glycerol-3-phosphate 3-phosphatidyltransferase